MTVSVSDEAASWLFCHSCGFASPLVDVVGRIAAHNYSKGLYELAQWVEKNDGPVKARAVGDARFGPVERIYTKQMRRLLRNKWPKRLLKFLKTKGVEPDVAREFRCAWDSDKDLFVCPVYVRSPKGGWRCIAAQGRRIDHKRIFAYFEGEIWHAFFGERLFPQNGTSYPILVEGPLDCMHLHGLGYPALSLLGKHVSDARLERLRRLAAPRRTHIMLDPDTHEDPDLAKKLEQKIAQRVRAIESRSGQRFRYTIHRLSQDPKYLTTEQLQEIV